MDIFSMLSQDEGLKLNVYKDTLGYWTVGIGHLLTKVDDKALAIKNLDALVARPTNGSITASEANRIFQKDVAVAKTSLQSKGLGVLLQSLNEPRQAALINMSFQLGAGGVAQFKKSMSLLASGKFEQAAVELKNSTWYTQTKNRATRVIETFRTGTWDAYQ